MTTTMLPATEVEDGDPCLCGQRFCRTHVRFSEAQRLVGLSRIVICGPTDHVVERLAGTVVFLIGEIRRLQAQLR